MTPKSLLDTDTLSAVMRGQAQAIARSQGYLSTHDCFTLFVITRYEILRGLKAKVATVQISNFERFCAASEILPLTDAIILRAADIYADLHQRGRLIGNADILIAATAMEHGLILVTNSKNHFQRIKGLTIANWLTV